MSTYGYMRLRPSSRYTITADDTAGLWVLDGPIVVKVGVTTLQLHQRRTSPEQG